MESSQHRPRDPIPGGKLSDHSFMFYKRMKSASSTPKTVEVAMQSCSVDSKEAAKLQYYSLRARTRSVTRAACLAVSGGDQGNVDRGNGSRVSDNTRKSQPRLASKHEALQDLSKVVDFEILNELSTSSGLSALEPTKFDSLFHNVGEKSLEINDQVELMETVDNPAIEEPMLSAESSTKRIYFRTRASSVKNSTSGCAKEERANGTWNNTQKERLVVEESAKSRKRCRKEEDEGELESTSKSKDCDVRNLWNQDDMSRKRVKQALHVFQTLYDKLSQEIETEMKPKIEFRRNRFDLMAFKLLRESNVELKFDSTYIGNVPGVEVGDEFHLRVELRLLGLHRQLQAGVDYCKQDGIVVARSIISSGCSRYSNNGQISEVLIYSGSGAPNKNQKLEYGNLALRNSIDVQNPIRVIRGFEDIQIVNSKSCKRGKSIRYIYDGLYFAEKFWVDKNDSDFDIFMFQLRRQKQQPELKIKQVKLRTSISFSDICVEDISDGKEKVPICAVNTIDEETPELFTYTKDIIYSSKYIPIPPKGCACSGVCADSIKCACAVKNGGELPFNSRGSIVQAKPLVYECGPSCKCSSSCHNRVSQHGIKYPLEVFKTKSMGWGLRSLSLITSGSFVCEYAGELIQDDDAQKRTNDEYLFAIGNNYHDAALWEGLPTSIPELQKHSSSEVDETSYTVDASVFGNVARFINHSCMPNLYAQNLLFDHGNKSMPHIMLFASEDIPPLQELTYHYNYSLDQVHDSNGNIKQKVCYCGTAECTGRLY